MRGAILGDVSAFQMTLDYLKSVRPNNIMLAHLWFIYYLLLAYGIVIAGRWLGKRIDPHSRFVGVVSRGFRGLLNTPFAIFVFAFPFAVPMMWMKGPWGIEIGFDTLAPRWPGLISYTMYLIAGWLIFRNIDQIGGFLRGWRWQLVLGLVLTLPYFAYQNWASHNGYATHAYPNLSTCDLQYRDGRPDYKALRTQLLSAEEHSIPGSVYRMLPATNQAFLKENKTASQDQLKGLLTTINKVVLADTKSFADVESKSLMLSANANRILSLPVAQRTSDQTLRLNREIIQSGFVGLVYSEDVHRPYYWLQRGAYCYGYSLITWALILGITGFFQAYFDQESQFSRYFSDASYWFYLAHLPIQFQILNWFGEEAWHPVLKFSLYVLGAIAVLLPSYHFLVRPTRLGWLLNGRRLGQRRFKSTQTESGKFGDHATSVAELSQVGSQR